MKGAALAIYRVPPSCLVGIHIFQEALVCMVRRTVTNALRELELESSIINSIYSYTFACT